MSKIALFVYSTLSADNIYRGFAKSGGDVPVPTEGVLIKGGANVMQRKTLHTPHGVATRVTPEQLEILNSDPVFLAHKENGYIRISEHEADPETVASDMENRDASAQLQEGDFDPKDEKQAQPVSTDDKPSKRRA